MLAGLLTLWTSPAAAATGTQCTSSQTKVFFLPSISPVEVRVYMCVQSSYGNGYYTRKPWAQISWTRTDPHMYKFDNFGSRVRLEHNDDDYTTDYCNYTADINTYNDGTRYCYAPSYTSSSPVNGWTSDGHIRWNMDGDGGGDFIWSLLGSPQVS